MCTKNTQFTPGTQTFAATASASNTSEAGRRALSLGTVVAPIASVQILEIVASAQILKIIEIMLFLMYLYYNSLNLQQLPIPPFKVKLSLSAEFCVCCSLDHISTQTTAVQDGSSPSSPPSPQDNLTGAPLLHLAHQRWQQAGGSDDASFLVSPWQELLAVI